MSDPSPGAVIRTAFGIATAVATVLALTGDSRWFAASGIFGAVWFAWDVLTDHVFGPLAAWITGSLLGGSALGEAPGLTLEDTIRLLESHLREGRASREVQIRSAVRLAEIYERARREPERAREVMDLVRRRFPDAPELDKADR